VNPGRDKRSGVRIVSSSKEYRKYADECLGWARTARSDRERAIFLQMAQTWLEAIVRLEARQSHRINQPCNDDYRLQRRRDSVKARRPASRGETTIAKSAHVVPSPCASATAPTTMPSEINATTKNQNTELSRARSRPLANVITVPR
jgi:hypothetical protein